MTIGEKCTLLQHMALWFVQEPADPSDPIYQHPNVIATPHTGVSTLDVFDDLFYRVSQNIIRQHDGGDLLHRLV